MPLAEKYWICTSLTVTKEEIDHAVEVLSQALSEM